MSKAGRERNKWGDTDLPAVFKRADDFARRFDQGVHGAKHREHILVYTSKQTLDTTAGTEFYSPYSGGLLWIKASVAGAPSGAAFKLDFLVDGNSVWDSDFLEIADGDKWSYTWLPNILGIRGTEDGLSEPTPLKFQINTLSGATGPMVCYIGLQIED